MYNDNDNDDILINQIIFFQIMLKCMHIQALINSYLISVFSIKFFSYKKKYEYNFNAHTLTQTKIQIWMNNTLIIQQ